MSLSRRAPLLARQVWDAHVFHYIVENGVTYLCMADEQSRRRVPFAFLEVCMCVRMCVYVHVCIAVRMCDDSRGRVCSNMSACVVRLERVPCLALRSTLVVFHP